MGGPYPSSLALPLDRPLARIGRDGPPAGDLACGYGSRCLSSSDGPGDLDRLLPDSGPQWMDGHDCCIFCPAHRRPHYRYWRSSVCRQSSPKHKRRQEAPIGGRCLVPPCSQLDWHHSAVRSAQDIVVRVYS